MSFCMPPPKIRLSFSQIAHFERILHDVLHLQYSLYGHSSDFTTAEIGDP